MSEDPLSLASELIPGEVYLCPVRDWEALARSTLARRHACVQLDPDLVYEPFCADFGPCNLAHSYRFCVRIAALRQAATKKGARLYLLVSDLPEARANAAVLAGIYAVMFAGLSASQACDALGAECSAAAGFRDASCGPASFLLSVRDVVAGIAKARERGLLGDWRGQDFDLEEYEHYEQVEHGDLNWIVPGKLLAFSGPAAQPRHYGGWRTFVPEDYVDYFVSRGVRGVVRLNKRVYEAGRFTQAGLEHHDLYFPDGTCPSESILCHFLSLCARTQGALAVHCKAGLGRTGVLICAHMILTYGFTAHEAMGYIRVCRPGSVIGPQQHYLIANAPRLLAAGGHALPKGVSLSVADEEMEAQSTEMESSKGSKGIDLAPSMSLDASSSAPTLSPAASLDAHAPASPPSVVHLVADARATRPEAASPARPIAATCCPSSEPSLAAAGADYLVSFPSSTADGVVRSASARSQTPARGEKGESLSRRGASTPSPLSGPAPAPPSSTKRVLAPNGQPRKIPMAMDFGAADALTQLEDTGEDDSWTVDSRPVQARYAGSTRVGALAAAAGRSANAFVEAFRAAVGSHRSTYRASHS